MKTRSSDEWRTIFKAYRESGLSQRAFCELHGVNLNSFAWQKQYKFKADLGKAAEPVFVPLNPSLKPFVPKHSNGVELTIGEIACLRINHDIDPKFLHAIFEALLACGRM